LTTASVAIDGSKFKAVNTRDKNFTRAKMGRRLAQIEESVARYLSQLDTADRQEPSEALAAKTAHLKEKLAKLASELQRLKAIEKEMLASPDQQISLTDSDSRSMATSGRGSGLVGYNVQKAVDTEHHLIVAHEVTNTGFDRAQLAKMASQAKEVLHVEHLDVVADRGYFNSPEILACEQAGISVTLPKPMTLGREGRWALRQAGLCLSVHGGCLPLSCGREADLSVHWGGRRQDASSLLDNGLSDLPAQISVHASIPEAHYPMGT
jgi:hypothetical protein